MPTVPTSAAACAGLVHVYPQVLAGRRKHAVPYQNKRPHLWLLLVLGLLLVKEDQQLLFFSTNILCGKVHMYRPCNHVPPVTSEKAVVCTPLLAARDIPQLLLCKGMGPRRGGKPIVCNSAGARLSTLTSRLARTSRAQMS